MRGRPEIADAPLHPVVFAELLPSDVLELLDPLHALGRTVPRQGFFAGDVVLDHFLDDGVFLVVTIPLRVSFTTSNHAVKEFFLHLLLIVWLIVILYQFISLLETALSGKLSVSILFNFDKGV